MFPRANRLRHSHEILTVFRRGTRRSRGPLTCYLIPASQVQVAVIVDKKVSKLATQRNLVKRRIRAALREMELPQSKIAVRAYQGVLDLSYDQIRANLSSCLREPLR
jgi:ribonuclease P protein component